MHKIEANGAEIPAIGMGTSSLKGAECRAMVSRALSAGYRLLDTAAMYGNETEVGEGLRESDVSRDKVFVITKVWYTDIADGDLQHSAQASLKRLGIDQVDLLLIHWPNPQIALEESIGALNAAREAGMTRHIGVSNFPTALLQQALALSSAPLVANQVEYHPYLDQRRVHRLCRENGMAMIAYCPLQRGSELLSHDLVTQAARRHDRSPAQIILRWHVQQDGVAPIPRTSRPERLAENLGVFDFALAEEEMAAISALRSANSRICDYEFAPQWDTP